MKKFFIPVLSVLGTLNANAFTVTCSDTGDVSCKLDGDDAPNVATDCSSLNNIGTSPVLMPHNVFDKCSKDFGNITCKYSIKYINQDSDVLVFCDNNRPTILYESNTVEDSSFAWSYAEKLCRGSDGTWKNGTCICPTSSQNSAHDTELKNDECVCKSGNTKYRINGSCEEGLACSNTGGIPNETECTCPETMESVKLSKDSDTKICQCKSGYRYRDPTRRWEGCVSINNPGITISGKVKDAETALPSATIFWYDEDGEQQGTTTDPNGNFSVKVPNTAYVTFSYLGYKPNTFAATDLSNNAIIILYPDAVSLSEVTITSEEPSKAAKPVIKFDLSECKTSGGKPDEDKNTCICDAPYETTTEIANDKTYSICKCVAGYKRENGNYTDKCVDANETETQEVLDTAKMREQAEAAYQAARDHEQSWANKGLTAGTTIATGLGTMTAASAFAEQRADAAAEADMRNYLATFKCEYGDGKTLNAGNEEITLPGGNELLEYYTEYKTLADSVKQTKTALGLRAGIESETLYDRAQSGLYQYTTAERLSGGEISLARALSDENSTDAARWNEQKAATASNLKTGAAVAVTGAAAGLVGNYLINRDYKPSPLIEALKPVVTRIANDHPQTFEPEIVVVQSPQVTTQPDTQTKEPEQQKFESILSNLTEKTFEDGKLQLSGTGKNDLDNLVHGIITQLKDPKYSRAKLKVSVTAYTDGRGLSAQTQQNLTKEYGSSIKDNDNLSDARANVIKDQIKSSFDDAGYSNIAYEAKGMGVHPDCIKDGKPVKASNEKCRQLILAISDEAIYE